MGFTFTPYQMIRIILITAVVLIMIWCFIKRHDKSGAVLAVILVLFTWFTPIRLTIDTRSHDRAVQSKIESMAKADEEELPPKFNADNTSYEDKLKAKVRDQ